MKLSGWDKVSLVVHGLFFLLFFGIAWHFMILWMGSTWGWAIGWLPALILAALAIVFSPMLP